MTETSRKPTPLTNGLGRGITSKVDWAISFNISPTLVTAVHSARMEIRRSTSRNTPVLASFYSAGGGGTGTLTIVDHKLTLFLPSSASEDFTFFGTAEYDCLAVCDVLDVGSNVEVQVAFGPVDINSRVTE